MVIPHPVNEGYGILGDTTFAMWVSVGLVLLIFVGLGVLVFCAHAAHKASIRRRRGL